VNEREGVVVLLATEVEKSGEAFPAAKLVTLPPPPPEAVEEMTTWLLRRETVTLDPATIEGWISLPPMFLNTGFPAAPDGAAKNVL
jgi:hypothetical protein